MWDNQFTCWPSCFRSSGKTALECGNLGNWSPCEPFQALRSTLREDYTALLFHANRTQSLWISSFSFAFRIWTNYTINGWNHTNHSLMTMSMCFFQCHSRYFSYSFLVSTSTQSWRSEGPQGSRLGLWGHHLWFKREEKTPEMGGFSRDFTGEMFDFQRYFDVFCNVLLQNRWLGFSQKIGRSEGSMIFFE